MRPTFFSLRTRRQQDVVSAFFDVAGRDVEAESRRGGDAAPEVGSGRVNRSPGRRSPVGTADEDDAITPGVPPW
jgi:hypothetical protein